MGGTKGCCWKAVPFRVVPDRGQVREDTVKSSNKETGAVLHEDVARSKTANKAMELGPEAGLGSADAGSSSCSGDVLARESPADEIDRFKVTRTHLSDVGVARDVRPVVGQHIPPKLVDLYLPEAGEPGALQPQVEPADTGEG